MNNLPVLRYILIELFFLIFWLLGFFIFVAPIYLIRGIIRAGKKHRLWIPWFLWLFLNDTISDKDAGDYGRYKHNFFGYFHQCAIRNSHWNLKLLLGPEKGKPYDIVPYGARTEMLNFSIYGKRKAFFKINGVKYFSKSLTRDFWFGKRIFNYQFGVNNVRYIFKIRNRKK